jgi:hypothetical protein
LIASAETTTSTRTAEPEPGPLCNLEEVQKVVERLKNDKAAGCDENPYEMYKFGGEFMVKKLHELYVEIWKEERVPSE